jgi:thiosulfate/3-mercaptopyruvate sulfurtransferase
LVLLDARPEERFTGEEETVDPVAGHIPGSVNRFYYDNLDDAGCYFRPAEALRQEFDGLLAGRPASRLIHTCGSGVTACQNLLAMEVAGLPGSRLYAGSWSEWCSDPSRPVER